MGGIDTGQSAEKLYNHYAKILDAHKGLNFQQRQVRKQKAKECALLATDNLITSLEVLFKKRLPTVEIIVMLQEQRLIRTELESIII